MPELYYISSGVRRAVARREAGFSDIPAVIIGQGFPIHTRLNLDQLHSPKPTVVRDFHYITRIEYPTWVLRTEPPSIEVELLGTPGQTASIPLFTVRLI